jgi:hypothetical protein
LDPEARGKYYLEKTKAFQKTHRVARYYPLSQKVVTQLQSILRLLPDGDKSLWHMVKTLYRILYVQLAPQNLNFSALVQVVIDKLLTLKSEDFETPRKPLTGYLTKINRQLEEVLSGISNNQIVKDVSS